MSEEIGVGGCGNDGAVGAIAVELFQLASLLVGSGGQALPLIENALGRLEADPCLNPEQAREEARKAVVREAVSHLAAQQPTAFASQNELMGGTVPCVEDDDLQAAGISPAQLQQWLDGGAEGELGQGPRAWLEGLPAAQRAVFVQRAVLRQGNEAAARLLREAGGTEARGWTGEKVSGLFRQALCSLANSLAHAPAFSGVPA